MQISSPGGASLVNLYVNGLSPRTKDEALQELFMKYGKVCSLCIV